MKKVALLSCVLISFSAYAGNVEEYHAKTIEAYSAPTMVAPQSRAPVSVAPRTVAGQRNGGGNVEVYESHSTPHVLTKAERKAMLRNDAAAGRTHSSMSRQHRSKRGTSTAARDRNNHYMNQQQLQNHMDQNGGLIGYNPYSN
jgi:hypothetical protein